MSTYKKYSADLLPDLSEILRLYKGRIVLPDSKGKEYSSPVLHYLLYKKTDSTFFEVAYLEYALFAEGKTEKSTIRAIVQSVEVFLETNLENNKEEALHKILYSKNMEDYWA